MMMNRQAQQHITWFELSRLNYITACGKNAWLTVDNALRQKRQNVRAMAKHIVAYDRDILRSEGYRP